MSFSPNLKVLSDWRSSLNVAFSVLRRIKFIIEGDFSFGDFDPQATYNGMTVTNYVVNRARYLRIGSLFLFSVDISATLAAPLTTSYVLSIPFTAAGASPSIQGGAGFNDNVGVSEVCIWQIAGTTNTINVYRSPASGSFGAGNTRARINGFLEII